MDKIKKCSTCILPESKTFPLDNKGQCNLCRSGDLLKHITKKPDIEKLAQMINKIKQSGKGREFDCLVAWSGGRDSTSMIYELVTRYNLRCAAVFGINPFTPKEIIDNVHSIAGKLKVKLIELHTPDNHLEIAEYCIKKYVKTGEPLLINLACAACKYINKAVFEQARRLDIKAVIYGGNRYEYFPSGPASIDINSENRYSLFNMFRDNALRLIKGFNFIRKFPSLFKYFVTFFGASLLYVNQFTLFLRFKYPDIFRFDYYYFANWDEAIIVDTLKKLEWTLPSGCNSTWRADCTFEAIKNKAFLGQFGFSYTHVFYSNLIRAENMLREEALRRLEIEKISETRLSIALSLCNLQGDCLDNLNK